MNLWLEIDSGWKGDISVIIHLTTNVRRRPHASLLAVLYLMSSILLIWPSSHSAHERKEMSEAKQEG